MDVQAFLETKLLKNKTENFFKELQKFDTKKDYSKLSKFQIELGLIFLNGVPALRDTPNDTNHNYYEYITRNSKRYLRISEIRNASKNNFWDENKALWVYFFGEEKAKYIKDAMEIFPKMSFQQDYSRRSFRAPNLENVHFENQLNTITKFNNYLAHDLTMAEYAIYSNTLYLYNAEMEYLWAAAINKKDKNILPLFLDIAYNRHDTAKVSNLIIKAMLMSENEQAWEAIEKLLLAAQRQEGLRQTILECLDETSLGAMKRFISLIIKEKLTRFSSVVRALDVWVGLGWEAEKESTIIRFMGLADKFLGEITHAKPLTVKTPTFAGALAAKDNAEIYMILWAQGVYDVEKTYPLLEHIADTAIKDKNVEKILLVLNFVKQINFQEINIKYALKCLEFPHLAVFSSAMDLLRWNNNVPLIDFLNDNFGGKKGNKRGEIFDILEKRNKEIPEKTKTFESQVFSWLNITFNKSNIYENMVFLTDFKDETETNKILAHFDEMEIGLRERVTGNILGDFYNKWSYNKVETKTVPTVFQRDFAIKIVKDRSASIRDAAMHVLENSKISDKEIAIFEEMLGRKSADLRKSVIQIFLKISPEMLQKSTENILKGNAEQRLAGIDLLTQIKKIKLLPITWIEKSAQKFSENPKITAQEKIMVDNLLSGDATLDYNAENGFGLYDAQDKTPYVEPVVSKNEKGIYFKETAKNPFGLSQTPENIAKAFQKLEKLYNDNKGFEYSYENWDNSMITVLLGNNFQQLKRAKEGETFTQEEEFNNYPLADVWKKWFTDSKITDLDLFLILLGKDLKEELDDAAEEEDDDEDYDNEDDDRTDAEKAEEVQTLKTVFPKTLKSVNEKVFIPNIPKLGEYYWNNPVVQILNTFNNKNNYANKIDFLEGFVRTLFASVDKEEGKKVCFEKTRWSSYEYTWRNIAVVNTVFSAYSDSVLNMSDEQFKAFWQLDKWKNETVPKEYKEWANYVASPYNFARAYSLGLITKNELFARVMKGDFIQELTQKLTERKKNYPQTPVLAEKFPFLNEFTDIARNRILEIELKRGDSSTPVTNLAKNLDVIYGMDNFVNILLGLGKDTLNRGYISSWGNKEYSKKEILSTLLKRCEILAKTPSNAPNSAEISTEKVATKTTKKSTKKSAKEDKATEDNSLNSTTPNLGLTETQKDFDEKIKASKLAEKRLVEAAMYAPQWLKFTEANLGWKDMSQAVWWLHAHANGYHSEETETEISKYSQVDIADFKEGGVDRDWFEAIYKSLGEERWKLLYESAKYISDGNGHTRAKLYADVILGNVGIEEITKRVVEKRNQDYLRVYGLVALNKKNPDKEVLTRYQFLQKFKKESKQFGSQRQASEGLAVRIAMDNLARTAGFSDPIRLTWAMETQEAIDIISRAKALTFGETTISLVVDEDGKASIECFKAEKPLKSIPDTLKKEPAIIELKEFNKTLNDQYKRTRKSLEAAMINGDAFTLSEITNLMNHPVVSPMLRKLVLKTATPNLNTNHPQPLLEKEGSKKKTPLLPKEGQGVVKTSFSLGFWKDGELVSPSKKTSKPSQTIQIAHCIDLYEDKNWADYQKYCFENEIKQPFKQIFRELYIPTADDLKEKALSRRYAGHQVQPRKTVALLKGQGWTVDYQEGLQKVFHKEGIIAKMYAMADWFSPSDVESPTLETIEFIDKKTWKNVPFEQLDKRIFSEVMRDIDLVVSVAHVGEVDPETSQSSIELCTALVRETMRLFKIANVELKGSHALIKGTKGDYSVHLGSAIAHKVASSTLFILPVHSQHRGKMFLPFLDEDPKTAEIMSKILLLAKDNEIQDPTILSQLL